MGVPTRVLPTAVAQRLRLSAKQVRTGHATPRFRGFHCSGTNEKLKYVASSKLVHHDSYIALRCKKNSDLSGLGTRPIIGLGCLSAASVVSLID